MYRNHRFVGTHRSDSMSIHIVSLLLAIDVMTAFERIVVLCLYRVTIDPDYRLLDPSLLPHFLLPFIEISRTTHNTTWGTNMW